ncbi:MAG: nicotinate-nucleotide adenylyltransferase [Caulobacteraceae bacterium]
MSLRLGFRLASGMRVGLYGGSFDPAHEGHGHVARVALSRLHLDRLIWLVSPGNPLKPATAASTARRMEAAARHAAGPSMFVSDAEGRLATRYTIDTVRALKRRFRGVHFVWVMGADSLAQVHRWRDWVRLFSEIPVAVIARPGFARRALFGVAARRFRHARLRQSAARRLALLPPPAWTYLPAPLNPRSSSELRARALTRGAGA